MVPAVAVRRHIHNEADMERRLSVHHRVSILSDLAVENFRSIIILHDSCRFLAHFNALTASYTLVVIDDGQPP